MDHPGPSAPVAGGSTSDLVEPASRRYSVNDIDELEGYLTRLAKLSSALPSKASLPNSPRSPSQRFHFAGGSATASLDAAVSPTTPASPLSRNGSSREASPRPSSTLEPFASYIAASNWLQGSLPIRRVRSKSLSDGSNSRVLSSPTVPSQPTSPQGPKSPLTAAHAGKRTAPPISWTPVASSTGRPGQRTPESQTAGSPQRSNTFVTAVPTDKFGSRRKIKRRSIPSPLPIASPSVGSAIEAGPSSARSESVHFTSFSIAESSEGEADASDPDIQVSRPASTATTTGPNIDRADTTDGVCNLRAETPVQASSVAHRTRRAMSSPLTSPAMADSLSTQSFRTSSTSSGGHLQARPSTANSQTRLQARSPFSGQSSPEWRKRHFPRRAASYDNDDVDEEATYHGQSRQRELMTATQALAELGRHEPAEPVVKARSRKISRESFSSKGSSLFEKGGKSLDDPRRESIDSRASSSHSIRLFGRSGKAPTMPASQTQSFGSVYSQPSPVATTSSGISAQQTRKPRLQARDDRHPPIRPKFTSTRSTSSLPLNGGNDTSAHDLTAGLSSDDDLDHRNPRRASIPNASAIYAAASTVLSNRASLAVPPAFGRSYSYDDSASHAALNPDLRAADNSVNARTRDMAQAVLLWVPDDAGSAVKVGHGRQLTKVLLGNVPRKKVTKRDSTHVLSAQADEGRPSTAKGKEVAKDRLPSTIPSGRWRQCEAVLKPTGQLSLFSDNAYLTSVSLLSLQRTDIRVADPSLLGRMRVLGIHLHDTAFSPLPSNASRFPTSPSMPDFPSFSSATSSGAHGERPSTGRSTKSTSIPAMQGGRPHIYLAFPSVATLNTWYVALQAHARAEVYPSLSKLSGALATGTLEEEFSSSGQEEQAAGSRSPRNRQGTGGWRSTAAEHSAQPLRFCRSVQLEIVEVRGQRATLPSSSTTQSNLHALAGLAVSPTSAHGPLYNPVLEIKRTASIASGSSATGTEGGSEDAASVHVPSPIPSSLPSLPNIATHAVPASQAPIRGGSGDGKVEKEKEKERKERETSSVFCEVCLDTEVLARTGMHKAGSSSVFHETFSFSNLPSFSAPLSLYVRLIRRNQQSTLGKVKVPLKEARKNTRIQDWWHVVAPSDVSLHSTEAIGEMSLNIKIGEDVVLPYEAYEELEQLLTSDFNLECLHSLVTVYPHLSLTDVSSLLLRIELAHHRLLPRLAALCEREVQTCEGDAAILFRSNSLFSKSVELYMRVVGSDFLEQAIGRVIRQICEERIEIEIDPSRMASSERMTEQVKELQKWTAAVWESIYNSRHNCPSDMRRLFRKIQQIAEKYFKEEYEAGRLAHLSDAERNKIRFTSISAFISLRFFGPAILNPRLFGLSPAVPPNAKTQRTLTLIAKVLQGLANMAVFGAKEPWMSAMNPFLQANWSSFEDFIAHLCGKPDTARQEWTSTDCDLYAVPTSSRKNLSPPIVKEGVPSLPFLIDLPRELSALAALVAQTKSVPEQRQRHTSGSTSFYEKGHTELQDVCCRIEAATRTRLRALERIGELGSVTRSGTAQRPIARSESTARNGQRSRGTTISSRTANMVAKALTPPRNAALYASAPTSNGSLSAEDSLASLTLSSDLSGKTKRRSHTVSAGSPSSVSTPLESSRVHHATSPIASPVFSPTAKRREVPFMPTASDMSGESDILEIHLPSAHDRESSASTRRTTISARPKLTAQPSEPLALTSSVPMPEPKTPRASVPSSANTSTLAFVDMQREIPPVAGRRSQSGSGGIEHELANDESEPAKQKKGFFSRRK